MSTPPRVRRVRFYHNENDKRIAREEFFRLDEAGQAALAELFTRFENGQERPKEVQAIGDGLLEFRTRVANNQYRAYFFKDGPRYVVVVLCVRKNQKKMLKADKDVAIGRMKSWQLRSVK
jgi:phage-related protein